MEIITYKKDKNKKDNERIIVKIIEQKTYYIITTKQAINDYYKTGFLPYDYKCYYKKLANKLLNEKYIKTYTINQAINKYKIIFENQEESKKVKNYIELIQNFFGDSLTNSTLFDELKRQFEIIEIKKI